MYYTKDLKEIFDSLHLELNAEIEQIEFIFDEKGYTNYIDTDSVFFAGVSAEFVEYGQLLLELCNITFTRNSVKPLKIIELFNKYQKKYTVPCIEFIREFYKDFRKLNLTDFTTRMILFDLLYWCSTTYPTLQELDYKQYFNYLLVITDPLSLTVKPNETTINRLGIAEVAFRFLDNKPIIAYYGVSPHSMEQFEIYNCHKHDVKFYRCSCCHEFFISHHRHNTKYCASCQNKSIEEKSSDIFYLTWRKKYLTMMKRERIYTDTKMRNKYHNKYTSVWVEDSQAKREEFKAQNDLEGFEKYLKETLKDKKYKPK